MSSLSQTQSFIAMFMKVQHWTCHESCELAPYPIAVRPIIILTSTPRLLTRVHSIIYRGNLIVMFTAMRNTNLMK